MSPGIDFEVIWEDDFEDLIQLTVHAENRGFGGTTHVYSSRRDIRELADRLKNFPESNNLETHFDAKDPHLGSLHLSFFCRDYAHHVSVLVEITRNSQASKKPSDQAQFVVDLEGAAALDAFRDSLYSISDKMQSHAQITGTAL
jgi:hypothetical protein